MAFFKDLLGEAYKPELTHEQLEALLSVKFQEITRERDAFKSASDKNSHEAKEWKDKFTEKLTEAEKQKLDYDELVKEKQALVKEKDIAKYTSQFIALGYDEALAKDTAIAQIEGNFDKVFENQKIFNNKVKEDFEKKQMEKTPQPNLGGTKHKITKEQFLKMGYEEWVKLQQDDPVLYAELTKSL